MPRTKKQQEPAVPEKILVDNPDCEVATKGYVKKLSRSVLQHKHSNNYGFAAIVIFMLNLIAGFVMIVFRMTPPPEIVSGMWTIAIASGIVMLDAAAASDEPYESTATRVQGQWGYSQLPDLEDATPASVPTEFKREQC